ncbi:hypothetical protein [Actinoplanes sp. NPDC023714]|uniref:hypothetical protein n=1 Tax=Actinoplanes sp. NPDC023714 TaxID=3154322 RepID=UPI0033C52217
MVLRLVARRRGGSAHLGKRLPWLGRRGWPLLAGPAIALLGAAAAPLTVQRAAEFSDFVVTARVEPGPGGARFPAPGRYRLIAVDPAPAHPECTASGLPLHEIPIKPTTPGVDGTAGTTHIGDFVIPEAGTYEITCAGEVFDHHVADAGHFRGAAGRLIYRPRPLIMLIGAIPGLLVIAGRWRRGSA